MSHSSGIAVGDHLREAFAQANASNKRIVKVQIVNEELLDVDVKDAQGSWEDDFSLISSLLDKEAPCYILYHLDDSWVMFYYVPDKAKIREKMTYASTRASLKLQLGGSFFSDEVYGTVPDDFTLKGYKHHIASKKAEVPLTDSEQMKKNELENSSPIYTGGSTTYVHGVAFPVDQNASDAINDVLKGSQNYACIAIDCDNEKVILDHAGSVNGVDDLGGKILTDQPRFHVYAWEHEFEGSQVKSIIYIYSSPDGSNGTKSAPVKMRMLYSSSKANVEAIIKSLGGKVDGKLEINTKEDITEEVLQNLIHPPKEEKKLAFKKPAGPSTRRLIRSPKP